jgi:hypothetical protein
VQSTQCLECKHYEGQHTCKAFPVKIPEEIMTGVHDHTRPFKGDSGIRFEREEVHTT